ncbi:MULTISPECIES: TonB-dependent receptor [Methylosinus]|uniref:TonB-dependent receptor n=1 Tax=Methylosinus TaxID=425 RepID=UPI0001D2E2E4|nr:MULTISPECIES: TonB-dependent siderophore receptor [Methylosinus]
MKIAQSNQQRLRSTLLISSSAILCFAVSESFRPAAAQEGRPAPTELPPITIDNASNQVRQTPVANNQDARSGQQGYITRSLSTATKTSTPLIDVPQSVSVITKQFIQDQALTSIGQAIRYVPGLIPHQGESHRDDLIIRGQRSNADFYVNGIRDDVQYFRDFYNLQRLEVLKGPNAMIFGRGGGGGVVNRVLKEADGATVREVTVGGNSFPGFRTSVDVGQAVNENVAVRFNAFYENTESYRDFVRLERYAFNPTITFAPTDSTSIKLSYEYLHDWRVTDRGIPSQQRPGGMLPQYPYLTSRSTYFGNPDLNYAVADVHIATGVVDHDFGGGLSIKNSLQFANYDKFYQNIYPGGAVNVAGTSVNLTSYNNETDRQNIFNQTDLTYKFETGPARHTVVLGGEVGHQNGLSYRQDGYFNYNPAQTTLAVSPLAPVTYAPVTFRNIASGANNTYGLDLGAAYLQDQVEITPFLQLIGGVRFDHFDLQSRDRRTGVVQARADNFVSPRGGIVVKPVENLSIYGSYSVSYLPSAGDQFSALTPGLAVAAPEKFENKEVGLKWDILPKLQFTTAFYDLDRTNQRLPDPNNAGFFILSGATKTRGVEVGLTGYVTDDWQISGGYAHTDAKIKSNTSASIVAGNRVGLVPYNTFSLWNRYQFTPMWGAGVGVIHYTDYFASSDDMVNIPGFTRVDAAVYFNLNEQWRAQLNVENLLDHRYIATADGNNNITPGAPRTFRFSVTANF